MNFIAYASLVTYVIVVMQLIISMWSRWPRQFLETTKRDMQQSPDPYPVLSTTGSDPTPVMTATIEENQSPDTLVQIFWIQARWLELFPNPFAWVSYAIIAGDDNKEFKITGPHQQRTEIRTTKPLDYEKKKQYLLTFRCTNLNESGNPFTDLKFTVNVINVNDNPPLFIGNFDRAIPENLQIGHQIVTVLATDVDGDPITYSIEGRVSKPYFAINTTTGTITLARSLDREKINVHNLIIIANDGVFSAIKEVTLNVTDVNDNPPQFAQSVYEVRVVEGSLIGSTLVTVSATDPDLGLNQTINYYIASGNTNNLFAISASTGAVTIANTLNHEAVNKVTLKVGARDQGTPIINSPSLSDVVITITDINDLNGIFTQTPYRATIKENVPIGTQVLKVSASDSDGTAANNQLTYLITDPLAVQYFSINPATGDITTKTILNFDLHQEFHFAVTARDGILTSSRSASVDVIITIENINDGAPVATNASYSISISEATSIGTSILRVLATDKDSVNLIYTFTNPQTGTSSTIDSSGKFNIIRNSGEILVKGILDRETVPSYTMSVVISDGVNTAVRPVGITINLLDDNDNEPAFGSKIYTSSISETSIKGTSVVQVQATDRDLGANAQIKYSIITDIQNPDANKFKINSDTGAITTDAALDYEQQQKYHFNVKATDQGLEKLSGIASVVVTVIDANDNNPIFKTPSYTVGVLESVPIGTFVVTVTATDLDSGIFGTISYTITSGNTGDAFKMVGSSISTNKILDFETLQQYKLQIRATDQGGLASATQAVVTINVLDVNDNVPLFTKSYNKVTIAENAAIGTNVLTLAATDSDKGANTGQYR